MVKERGVTAVRGRRIKKEKKKLKNNAVESQDNAVIVVLILGLLGCAS